MLKLSVWASLLPPDQHCRQRLQWQTWFARGTFCWQFVALRRAALLLQVRQTTQPLPTPCCCSAFCHCWQHLADCCLCCDSSCLQLAELRTAWDKLVPLWATHCVPAIEPFWVSETCGSSFTYEPQIHEGKRKVYELNGDIIHIILASSFIPPHIQFIYQLALHSDIYFITK